MPSALNSSCSTASVGLPSGIRAAFLAPAFHAHTEEHTQNRTQRLSAVSIMIGSALYV